MRVVVTGAGGFVGRALCRAIGPTHEVIGIDRSLNGVPGIEGDFDDPDVIARALAGGCDAVVHLATLGGGAAEQDPAAAFAVNVAASVRLAQAASAGARFVFASSIAVFGDPLPPAVDDATPLAPRMLYGAHKAMVETWLDTLTRRGDLATLSLRLPGIVARPRGPSGMKSAFMSDLFHALSNGEAIDLPVSAQATMWLMSVDRIAANLAHALAIDATGAVTLPALRVTMGDLVATVSAATGQDAALARYTPDPAIEAGFGRQPPLATPRAQMLGFAADPDLDALVRSALARCE